MFGLRPVFYVYFKIRHYEKQDQIDSDYKREKPKQNVGRKSDKNVPILHGVYLNAM